MHLQPYRKEHPHSRLLTIQAVFYLAFVVFLFLLCGVLTNANPGGVLLGFLPALAFGIITIILVETDHFNPAYNWLVLASILVITTITYVAAPIPAIQNLDAGTVITLNAIIMIVALFIFHSSYSHEKPIPIPLVQERKEPTVINIVQRPKEIADVIKSIEDKIKSLNFVIGRVYSVYHGGTDRLRNKIRVDKEWYNEFNVIDEKDFEKKKHEAIVLLQKIKDRLDLLQKSEAEVLGDEIKLLKNIQHDVAGKNKIIDVLIRNDKDPVEQYYSGARQFCEETLKDLKA